MRVNGELILRARWKTILLQLTLKCKEEVLPKSVDRFRVGRNFKNIQPTTNISNLISSKDIKKGLLRKKSCVYVQIFLKI